MGDRWDDLYSQADRARLVSEPVKRVDAPERTPFERDRARVVHSAALRRLSDKTQVLGPQRDFVRNRLTHSLEVAQVGRDVAHVLGCHPDLVETAALAHDLGHPPFGHNGEVVLAELGAACGGFEGNAQTLRILTRLEAKSEVDGASVGLNLTRATLDACTKYPWSLDDAVAPTMRHVDGSPRAVRKFGVYGDDLAVFTWLREGIASARRCVEAQVMDLADDVAYSVHDVEDGVVAGGIDLPTLDSADARQAVWETVRGWYLPDAQDERLEHAWQGLRAIGSWPDVSYDGTRPALRSLKNLTSDLIGRFCGAVEAATRAAYGDQPLVRHGADVVVPTGTATEIAVLKGVAAHYVMSSPDRLAAMERQRQLLAELTEAVAGGAPDTLSPDLRADFAAASDDRARLRVVLDHVASLTDTAAVHSHERLGLRSASRP